MSTVKTFQQFLTDWTTELQNRVPAITDVAQGSIVDAFGGATAFVMSELSRLTVQEFAKCFFDSSNGPAVTGGPDDLQTLALDKFGTTLARPSGNAATGSVTFSRPTTTAGNVSIAAGTIVLSGKDANGNTQSFSTDTTVTLTGTSLTTTVTATTLASAGNIAAGAIKTLGTALTDPTVTVTNASPMSGGLDPYTDAQYREFIRNSIATLRAAVRTAIESACKAVPGIVTATLVEVETPVMPWNIATGAATVGASYFRIPVASVYVADASGAASGTEVTNCQAAVDAVRAAGTYVPVLAATGLSLNWTGHVVLNPAGPNYVTFSSGNLGLITDAMAYYINTLPIGTGFDTTTSAAAILAIFGSSGTNDLTTFTTTSPAVSVAGVSGQKIVAGTMATS